MRFVHSEIPYFDNLFSKRKFKYALSHIQFNTCPNDEAKEVFSGFNKGFTDLYDKHFPIKRKY